MNQHLLKLAKTDICMYTHVHASFEFYVLQVRELRTEQTKLTDILGKVVPDTVLVRYGC